MQSELTIALELFVSFHRQMWFAHCSTRLERTQIPLHQLFWTALAGSVRWMAWLFRHAPAVSLAFAPSSGNSCRTQGSTIRLVVCVCYHQSPMQKSTASMYLIKVQRFSPFLVYHFNTAKVLFVAASMTTIPNAFFKHASFPPAADCSPVLRCTGSWWEREGAQSLVWRLREM